MATLVAVDISRAGVVADGAAAAGGGDAFLNTGAEILVIKNGSVSSINVTLVTQATVDGNAVADPVVAVAAGVTKAIGPFPRYIFGDANGLVQVTYSAVTSLTVKVLRLTPAGS